MNRDKALVIRTYVTESDAIIAKSRLRFEGIEALMQKCNSGVAYPSLQMIRGVRLLVQPENHDDTEKILNQMEVEEFQKLQNEAKNEDPTSQKSDLRIFPSLFMEELPSQQFDELKSVIFTYVLIAPLLSALFANNIDNIFVVCLLFVGLVGTAFVYLRNRLSQLEELIKDQERRLLELEGGASQKFD
ncbi:MAG: hypothetical protein ACP5VS_16150 [Desulfomonilaceae bacterium]